MEHDKACAEDRNMLADSELDAATGGLRRGFATSFPLTVGGHTEAAWTPRTYSVQTDLSGGVTGAQASLYERRRS